MLASVSLSQSPFRLSFRLPHGDLLLQQKAPLHPRGPACPWAWPAGAGAFPGTGRKSQAPAPTVAFVNPLGSRVKSGTIAGSSLPSPAFPRGAAGPSAILPHERERRRRKGRKKGGERASLDRKLRKQGDGRHFSFRILVLRQSLTVFYFLPMLLLRSF